MFEAGLLFAGFLLLFVITWFAGRYFSERNAVQRVLKRRGYGYAQSIDGVNEHRLEPYLTPAARRSAQAEHDHAAERLKRAC